MKINLLLSLFFVSILSLNRVFAQTNAPIPPKIENPELLGINKEPYHATLMPYANLQEALVAKRHASSLCQSLNGQWKFNWVPTPEKRPADFYKPDFDVSGWKEIPVPSNCEVHGYGTPFYRNLGYTIKKDYPHVMSEPDKKFTAFEERNPVGSYRRERYETFTAKGVVLKETGSVVFGVLVDKGIMEFPEASDVKVDFKTIGINGKVKVRDLWSHKDLGIFNGSFSSEISQHGAGLYRLTQLKTNK